MMTLEMILFCLFKEMSHWMILELIMSCRYRGKILSVECSRCEEKSLKLGAVVDDIPDFRNSIA